MATEHDTLPDQPHVGRSERVALIVITATFAVLLGLWAVIVPPFQAPDEQAHFDSAVHLAIGDPWVGPGDQRYLNAVQRAAGEAASLELPAASRSTVGELLRTNPGIDVGGVDQMTQHPPTAYVLQAVVLRLVGFEHLRWDHALLALRLLDALLVLPLPVLAWASVRRITRTPRAALVAAAALTATPELASIGASVTNDALTMGLGGLVTLLVVRTMTGDRRYRTLTWLAVALGALVLAKGTGLAAVPFVGVALIFGSAAITLSRRTVETAGVLVAAGAIGGWWWVRNLVVLGTLQPDGYAAIRPPRAFPPGQGPSVSEFVNVSWGTITRTFWGSFGANAGAAMSPWLVVPLTLVAVGVLVGWGFRRSPVRRSVVLLVAFPVMLVLAQTITSISGYLTTTTVVGTQGRYFFPGVVALVAVSAIAWRRLPLPRRGREALPAVITAVSLAVAAAGLVTARVVLVPGRGYAVWSDGPLGGAAVTTMTVVAAALAAVSVIAVTKATPGRHSDAAIAAPRDPR